MSRRATLFVPALGYRKPLPENLAASKPQPVDEEWKADLVIMDSLSKENNGYKYILTVIDVLSKYTHPGNINTQGNYSDNVNAIVSVTCSTYQ